MAGDIDPYPDPDAYPPEANTFAALVQDETDPAHGIRIVQAFQLDPSSVSTTVNITNTSSDLAYTTDLTAVVPVQVPMGTATSPPGRPPNRRDPTTNQEWGRWVAARQRALSWLPST